MIDSSNTHTSTASTRSATAPSHRLFTRITRAACFHGIRRPGTAASILLGVGLSLGAGAGIAHTAQLRSEVAQQDAQLSASRREAQRELNALAARMGELQAQANRLNALGDRLTRVGQLRDGEFDFNRPVGTGGAEQVRDMPRGELDRGLATLDAQFDASGAQLSVLESLLTESQLDSAAVPSREPIAGSYVTSSFGYRADPITGGSQFHKGIDFEADVGDPVLAVADGVVSYSGDRSGYGNTVEVDHGNGYVTRYAHNSRLTRGIGALVRAGDEIAKAGSTGRSTGAHVHFEVWQAGRVVDPRAHLPRSPVAKRG